MYNILSIGRASLFVMPCLVFYNVRDGAGYPIVDFGGWRRGVGPNCMEMKENFGLE
jgi:hypothetical protein